MTPVPPVAAKPRGHVHVSLSAIVDFFAQRRKAVAAFLGTAGPLLAGNYLGPSTLHIGRSVWYVVVLDALAALGVHAIANKGQGGAP